MALAENNGEPLSVMEIGKRQNIPRKFLEAILVDLKRGGVVTSSRGKAGGYQLALLPQEITFSRVIRLLDGPLALVPCVSKTFYQPCDDCPNEEACQLRKVLGNARDAVAEVLEAYTIADAVVKI